MVTIVIDEGTIVAIAIPFVIVAFVMLFFAYTETKSELEYERWKSSFYENECEEYSDKYLEYKQKYEKLQKEMEVEHD